MDSRNSVGFNMPLRAAPSRPTVPSKYAPVVGWDDRPFANDPFEPYSCMEKRKPPPRPPPPKISKPQTESRPLHFNRKPTILSNLLGRKPRTNVQCDKENNKTDITSADLFSFHLHQNDSSGTSTGVLIDFTSPPSSPTFTTRSSSDGLSIDSFGSDVTSSTHNHNNVGGNASQAESGFEDDFDLFSSRKSNSTDLSDPWGTYDPFSPPKLPQKPAIPRKPIVFADKNEFPDPLCNGKTVVAKYATHKVPTIIRSKPMRPKPPDNSALLANSLTSVTSSRSTSHTKFAMHGSASSFPTTFELDFPSSESSPEREPSPPMPTIPPPPPPVLLDEDELPTPLWPEVEAAAFNPTSAPYEQPTHLNGSMLHEEEEPYAVATFDFPAGHEDDLPLSVGTKVRLLRKVNDEWMYGRLRNGMEGVFPINYVEVKIPLKDNQCPSSEKTSQKTILARVMYDFRPEQPDDLALTAGSIVKVTGKVCNEWLLGECNGSQGQFPANYVEYLP